MKARTLYLKDGEKYVKVSDSYWLEGKIINKDEVLVATRIAKNCTSYIRFKESDLDLEKLKFSAIVERFKDKLSEELNKAFRWKMTIDGSNISQPEFNKIMTAAENKIKKLGYRDLDLSLVRESQMAAIDKAVDETLKDFSKNDA